MPLLDIFFAMLYFFFFIAWIMVLFTVISDLFRNDMGGFAKAIWVAFLVFLPVLGVLVYLLSQGDGMAQRQAAAAKAAEDATRTYIRDAAATPSPADELSKLAGLRDSGAITDDEFAAQKAKILA